MAGHAMEIPQIIQSASINHNPDPVHDLNPATTASEKQPVVVGPDSETNSIASDIVHPSRVIRPVHRRQTLPPLPDLRFEQSYLASIKDADTWGRVAWITTRDQVCSAAIHLIPLGCQEQYIWQYRPNTSIFSLLGTSPSDPRNRLDTRALRLALLESQCLSQRAHPRQSCS